MDVAMCYVCAFFIARFGMCLARMDAQDEKMAQLETRLAKLEAQ